MNRKLRSSLHRGLTADLSHAQMAALAALDGAEVRMTALAGRLGLAESSVTRLVDRLETAGFVERAQPPGDRRCVAARLTPEGSKLLRQIRVERGEFLKEILETLEPTDRDELVRLFGKVAEELRAREVRRAEVR
jgi:DNA-binding MarR family transcriptional regulator